MTVSVSVVIPTHNRAGYVGEAVASVLSQVGVDVEVIVVDDASTDDTREVLERFGDSITVIGTGDNIERGAARNLGASRARYGILAFLDSDDVWRPDKLATQLRLSKGSPSVTGLSFIDGAGSEIGRTYVPPPNAKDLLLLENRYLGTASSLMISADLFEKVDGFPEELSVQGSEDWLLLIKLAAISDIQVIDSHLLLCRIHQSNFTSDPASVARSMWSATKWMESKGMADDADLRRVRARTAGVIARQFAVRGSWGEAGRWIRRSLSQGSPKEGIRAVAGTAASGARALLPRSAR